MRFDSTSNVSPPPLGPSWRMILWGMTLAPALLILGWSLRQARSPKPEFGSAGLTAEETQRLKRILKQPRDDASSPLRGDEVRVIAGSAETPAELDKGVLINIKDNTFGVTSAEKPAYDAILSKLRNASVAELEQSSHSEIPFAVLMLDADRYRGEALTIEGDIRRLNQLPDQTFEAWLFTPDSGINPYRVVLARLPDGISLEDESKLPIRARVTGYFFKRYSYATANDFHTAPLLLAKSMTLLVNSKSVAESRSNNSRSLSHLAIGILASFLIVGLLVKIVPRRRGRQSEESKESPPDFTWLNRP